MMITQILKSLMLILFFAILFSCGESPSKVPVDIAHQNYLSDSIRKSYSQQGRQIVKSSFLTLSTKLQTAITELGTSNALHFCEMAALPLTDSLSAIMQVTIKRVASKYRNPLNQPNAFESSLLNYYEGLKANSVSFNDTILQIDPVTLGYYKPIIMLEPCLQCHGAYGTDITDETFGEIIKLYPDDLANGFKVGDLRGMWFVAFSLKEGSADER